jgi:peptide/nickel transport system substrate-binding protein
LQERAYQVVPYVPFGQWFLPVAVSPRLSGLLGMPGIVVPWNIEKAAR